MKSLVSQLSDNEFIEIVKNSNSINDCLKRIGYSVDSGTSSKKVRDRIRQLNIDTTHFYTPVRELRTEENVFVKDSTATQNTLKNFFLKRIQKESYKCSICGLQNEWQGKPLTLILDHINGDNKDNRLENLRLVCPNCNSQLETTGSKNYKFKETLSQIREKEHFYCIDCGKEISHGAVRCQKCYGLLQNKNSRIPSRDELKQLIRTLPFTTIGNQFNVSDNTIRKWCLKYGLPQKSKDIKSYSDEEWEII